MSNKKFSGRPAKIPELWDRVFDALPSAFWNHKGLSGNCPFCGAVSDASKMKFLIRFLGSEFKGYNCFICSVTGSGFPGIQKLMKSLGTSASTFDVADMVGSDFETRLGSLGEASAETEGEVGPIDWPPNWINETDEVFISGLNYMESRGIVNASEVVEKHSLLFSEQVRVNIAGDSYLKDYPCIVAPMRDVDGDVVGFVTRRIGQPLDGEPKSIDASGRLWKTQSLFGIDAINPRRPVTIVEGLFSALSTPNAVAAGGKNITSAQVEILASTQAKVFIFALDPEVQKKHFADVMYRLSMEAPDSYILRVRWEDFPGGFDQDPNDRGQRAMAEIIHATIAANSGSE
jgi:hypothetical protein